jgi:hypothetical protein
MRPPTQKELTDPQSAYCYALYVIKERFELGEPAIATSPQWAYAYAYDVIKEHFELGEPLIATAPYWAYWYALNVLNFNKNHLDFYEQCFRNKTLYIEQLPQYLQDNEDIQIAYFKAKILT